MHYIPHLSKDKKLKKLVESGEPHQLKKRKNICTYLCASIMSQQLSVKVADVIYKRFLNLYGGKEPTPQQILDTPFEQLRGIGLSNAKVNYVKNVAQFEIESGMDAKKLGKMDNEEVITYLTQIKGVGLFQLAIPCVLVVLCTRVLKAPEVALLGLLEVIFGILLAWVGAGEVPGHDVLVGGSLVIGALVVNELVAWRERA